MPGAIEAPLRQDDDVNTDSQGHASIGHTCVDGAADHGEMVAPGAADVCRDGFAGADRAWRYRE